MAPVLIAKHPRTSDMRADVKDKNNIGDESLDLCVRFTRLYGHLPAEVLVEAGAVVLRVDEYQALMGEWKAGEDQERREREFLGRVPANDNGRNE